MLEHLGNLKALRARTEECRKHRMRLVRILRAEGYLNVDAATGCRRWRQRVCSGSAEQLSARTPSDFIRESSECVWGSTRWRRPATSTSTSTLRASSACRWPWKIRSHRPCEDPQRIRARRGPCPSRRWRLALAANPQRPACRVPDALLRRGRGDAPLRGSRHYRRGGRRARDRRNQQPYGRAVTRQNRRLATRRSPGGRGAPDQAARPLGCAGHHPGVPKKRTRKITQQDLRTRSEH